MSGIHPRAIVHPQAEIGDGVRIGPWCQVGANAVIEDDVEMISHVVVDGHTRIGAGAVLYPFCTVGMAPQDLKYKGEPTLCSVGARTQVREHVTIHRGTVTGTGATSVGEGCLLMASVHVAHDCAVGNNVVVANSVLMGGHVTIGDFAVIGGGAAIHQFTRIGRMAMIGGMAGVEADVIPFGTVIGNRARLAGLNLIGLKRRIGDRAGINAVRAAFRLMFRSEGVFAERVEEARAQYGEEPLVAEMLNFIDHPSRRGLIRAMDTDTPDDDPA
jgi:UDP-N-acetylglucosamine acyltransferase